MEERTIDCTQIRTKEDLHRIFRDTLGFPEWYGNNLDALYDCLTDIQEDITVTLLRFDTMGSFRAGFRAVLEEAEQDNSHLIITIS